MTYEEALQIAMEELDGSADSLRRLYESYENKIDDECRRLQIARETLEQQLRRAGSEREWVGLTQEELQDLCVKSYHTDNAGETHFNRGYFADAIEAKLKEKNMI